MPHVTVRGVEKAKLCQMETQINSILSDVLQLPVDSTKVFYSPLEEVKGGTIVATLPSVNIFWFPRGDELCDVLAQRLTDYFQKEGFANLEVTFTDALHKYFYFNGKSFK